MLITLLALFPAVAGQRLDTDSSMIKEVMMVAVGNKEQLIQRDQKGKTCWKHPIERIIV